MKKQHIIIGVVLLLIVAAGAFWGGMTYAARRSPVNFQNLTPAQRQQMFGTGGRRGAAGGANGAGFVTGDIIAKDDKSITVKLTDGGSKIIFFSDTTNIGKIATGSSSDLTVGERVTVNGQANSDGSVAAQMIQIRPAQPPTTTSGSTSTSTTLSSTSTK